MRALTQPLIRHFALLLAAVVLAVAMFAGDTQAADKEKPVKRDYSSVFAPPAPQRQSVAEMMAKSDGCTSCHVKTDAPTMHLSPAVRLGCTDCHGGNASVKGNSDLPHDHPDYVAARDTAHVLPKYPNSWHFPSSANPKRSYVLLNQESPEFVKFVNPSDYRVARDACGACHIGSIEAAERSIMATGAMLWGGASYNNGILPFKNYLLGEAYTREGLPAKITSPGAGPDGQLSQEQTDRGVLAELYPLPTWQVIPPGDVFRVFERGGRTINSQFPEIGLPNPSGAIQRLEEPSTSTRPGSTIPSPGSWAPMISRAITAIQAVRAATWSMLMTANRAIRWSMRNMAAMGRRSLPTRRLPARLSMLLAMARRRAAVMGR
jgi:hypothetical protein